MSNTVAGDDPEPSEWANAALAYDAVAAAYATRFLDELDHKPFDRDLLRRFADSVAPHAGPDRPVCDLGCGPGHVGAFVAASGVDVIGIDLSTGMIEQAQSRFPALSFTQGDMTVLQLPDGALSAIVCFYALIHIPRLLVPVALGEMLRCLASGGALLLAVHGGEGTLHASEMLDCPVSLDATLFTLSELTDLVASSGFVVKEAHERAPLENEVATQRLYVWANRQP